MLHSLVPLFLVQFSNAFLIQINICNVVIYLVGLAHGQKVLMRTFFFFSPQNKKFMGKMNGKNTSETKAAGKVKKKLEKKNIFFCLVKKPVLLQIPTFSNVCLVEHIPTALLIK